MLKVITLILVALAVLIRPGDALTCFPCDEIDCPAEPDCDYGVGRDVCGCCSACLKGSGEECGGPWDILGHCTERLICEVEDEEDYNSFGKCVADIEQNETRRKRGLAGGRRAGLSRVQASQHSHHAHSGIPEHIKQLLRAKGVKI